MDYSGEKRFVPPVDGEVLHGAVCGMGGACGQLQEPYKMKTPHVLPELLHHM